jgi:hypothetical protein
VVGGRQAPIWGWYKKAIATPKEKGLQFDTWKEKEKLLS